MAHYQLRRQIITDRLEGLLLDVERFELEAFDVGDIEEACHWFELAAIVRASLELAKTADA